MKTKNDILIKVLSLSIGLSVGIVLIAKVFFELSYDSFYKDIDRVYTIRNYYSQHGDEHDYGQVSGAVPVGFMEEVPGIEVGTRITYVFNGDTYLDEDGNKLKATLVCADTCFFKVFDRPILAGEPVKALGKWGGVMVSRSFAEKLGGLQECIGKQIANADMDGLKLTIEGVFEDFPKNGSLDYDILLSMDTYGKRSTDNWLGNDRYKGYVKLAPGIDPNTLSDAIRKMQEAHQPLEQMEAQGISLRYFLSPFSTMHTSSPKVKTQVILLSIIAALLIIISLLNYILIVISSMVKRSKEVGVRKCYGAEGKAYLLDVDERISAAYVSFISHSRDNHLRRPRYCGELARSAVPDTTGAAEYCSHRGGPAARARHFHCGSGRIVSENPCSRCDQEPYREFPPLETQPDRSAGAY